MGVRRSLNQLAENLGGSVPTLIDKLGEEIRQFSCELWELYPDRVAGDDDVGSSFIRGVMNEGCADLTLPPPPQEPFQGGQCEYLYKVAFRYGDVPGVPPTLNSGNNVCLLNNVVGPIQAVSGVIQGNSGTLSVVEADGTLRQCTGGYDPGQDTAIFIIPPIGFPDNCGNPPPEYPETNPTPQDYQKTININIAGGETVNYNLEYKPTNYSFPMEFDVGGLNVSLDLGGLDFNFSPLGSDGFPLPLPNGNQSPLPAPRDDGGRQVGNAPTLPPNSDDYIEEEKTETDPKEEIIGAEIEFVKVTLTNVPANIKNQFGDGAPNVLYAGWFEFQADGYNFPRQPVHFNQCIYRRPEGATGYAYTLYEGISGKATTYKLKQEE